MHLLCLNKNGGCLGGFISTDKNMGEKLQAVIGVSLKIVCVLGLLYLFICSLDFLSSAFRLLGGTYKFMFRLDNE